jgi:hypothetical protein
VQRLLTFVVVASLSIASMDAMSFILSDGTKGECTVDGRAVQEIDAAPDSALVQRGHVAITKPAGSGYQIQWNATKLAALPPAMRDLIFFHECAHAQIPTTDELRANCVGLRMMRAAGKGGFAVESKLAAFYGPGNDYWARTLKCADKEPAPSSR